MTQPQAYNRETDFTERDGDDTNHAGINTELDAAALSINELRDNLALIQRDDGALKNGIVTAESLSDSAFNAVLGEVATATAAASASADRSTLFATQAEADRIAAQAAASAAQSSQTAAATSATAAANSQTAAANSATAAATSASTATTKANEASTSASNAATSATSAATSASTATTKASEAATSATSAGSSATTATTQAGIATTQASNAAASATAASASFDEFDDRYLGSKTVDPTTDNDGNALLAGALYFNSVAGEMRVWAGTFWKAAGSSVGGTINTAKYTATAGQTTFAIVYDVGFVHVYLNGVKLESGVEFTANNGTSVVLATGATAGDVVDMIAFGIFSVANTYTKAELNAPTGSSLVGFTQSGTGAVLRTSLDKMRDIFHVADFGALGGFTGIDDTLAIRAAIAAAPAGSRVVLGRGHTITDTITVNKPLTLVGGGKGHPTWVSSGSNVDDNDYTVRLTATNKTAFLIAASATNFPYYSPQVAAMGVTFRDMKILGPGNQASASLDAFGSGIATDLSLVGTNPSLHYREIVLDNVTVRFFNIGLNFQGICYINKFHDVVVSNVNIGYYSARGGANDTGGQTRMYGCTFLFHAQWGIKWDYTGSTLSLFGCTVSEGNGGIWLNEEAGFFMSGCEIENNKTNNFSPGNASAAGLYINIAEANPNSDAIRYVVGNKFLFNTKDIWIEKTVAGWTSGINYPMVIDGNALLSSIALQCDTGIDQSALVFGASNAGNNNGRVADSQLVNFAGSDLRDFPYKMVKVRGSGYPVNYHGVPVGAVNLAVVAVPNGATLYLEDIERYTFSTPAGARATAQLLVLNASNAELINLAGNGITTRATWTNNTGATVNARIYTDNGYGTGNPMYISLFYRVA